ncbi:MAG TPA: cytochrome c biogenesis heme-transporting ATPase CcmA [Casimicrobiaceae bacterium]|jgi:heme exporter protein A|nr:cytochrome c biogenesis heme-transporting ATPase CcmA [Casimicrobiaceae bacterium]
MSDDLLLEARGLAAQRGYATLFAGIAFSLRRGQALVVQGRNGSGKSTLLRIAAGLTMPSAGEIRWRGQAMRAFDARLREAVAFQGHAPALKDELTAFENLDAWTSLHGAAVSRAAIDEALDAVALSRRRRLPVRVLSQGQRRRIGLARLALCDRVVWILDEPLTALDAEATDVLGRLLSRHLAANGICIAASHQALPLEARRMQQLSLGEEA